jgi:mannitol-specific phosphotransferase system IIBC component
MKMQLSAVMLGAVMSVAIPATMLAQQSSVPTDNSGSMPMTKQQMKDMKKQQKAEEKMAKDQDKTKDGEATDKAATSGGAGNPGGMASPTKASPGTGTSVAPTPGMDAGGAPRPQTASPKL